MVQVIPFTGQKQRHRHRKWTCGYSGGCKGGWDKSTRKSFGEDGRGGREV